MSIIYNNYIYISCQRCGNVEAVPAPAFYCKEFSTYCKKCQFVTQHKVQD